MQIPAVGTQITVIMDNITRRNSWDPDTITFAGAVAPTFKWLDSEWFCMLTGDPLFPVRTIKRQRVQSITVAGVTTNITHAPPAAIKQGTWQVKGSKGDMYTVTRNSDSWGCDCKAMKFGRNTCKHVKSIQVQECT